MISIKPLTSPNSTTPTHLLKILASRVCLQSIQDQLSFQLVRPAQPFLVFPNMRFITDLKFLSFVLSLSIAAPIAEYFESAPAGTQIDNGIESFSNELSTGSSSPGAAADNQFLMAARRQRPQDRRYRPSLPPPFKGTVPLEDDCQPGSDGSNCQQGTKPTPIPVGEQSDTPDPLLEDAPDASDGAFRAWGPWDLLSNPDNVLSH